MTECEALARLARLSLEPGEAELLGPQLATIITYIDALAEVELGPDAEEYLSAAQPDSSLRDDSVTDPLRRDDALAGAPATRDGHVLVPKFKED